MPRMVTLTIKDEISEWQETYKENESGSFTTEDTDLQKWAEDLVDKFNAKLRVGELKRELVKVYEEEYEEENIENDEEEEDEYDDSEDDEEEE